MTAGTMSIDEIRERVLGQTPEKKKDMRPRDAQGRLLKASQAEPSVAEVGESLDLTDAERTAGPAETFDVVRVWTAGPGMPQDAIFTGNVYRPLRPERDGAYYVNNEHDLAVLRKALGARFWLDTIPENEPAAKCDVCQWHTRSYPALIHHANHAHGRAQQ